jgi:hypothetical protein
LSDAAAVAARDGWVTIDIGGFTYDLGPEAAGERMRPDHVESLDELEARVAVTARSPFAQVRFAAGS